MFEDFRLKVFLTVARCGSFTAAGKELGISQPAVSQNVSELERQLGGVVLFDRKRGSMALTPKGEAFVGYARQILHWYRAAEQAIAHGSNPQPPVSMDLGDGRKAEFWASQGDIHINIMNK